MNLSFAILTPSGLITPSVIEGSYSDLIQLTQPEEPTATDWAEEDYLQVTSAYGKLKHTARRPLSFSIFLPKGEQLPNVQNKCRFILKAPGTSYTLNAEIHTIQQEHYKQGTRYTLKGEILQDYPSVSLQMESLQIEGEAMKYAIDTITLGKIGVTPLDGTKKALQDLDEYKKYRTQDRKRASREATFQLLLRAKDSVQLLHSRSLLDCALFEKPRNLFTTPFGVFPFFFKRSRVRDYDLLSSSPFIIYEITIIKL